MKATLHPINPTDCAMFRCMPLNALLCRHAAAGFGVMAARSGVANDGAPPGARWNG